MAVKKIEDVLFIIQARVGSSRTPQKMIRPFCESTLIELALEKVLQSEIIPMDNFILAVGDPELIEIGQKLGVNIFKRSPKSVRENSDVKIIYEWHNKVDYKYWIKINACQPLLKGQTIDRFVREYLSSNCEGMFSVIEKRNYFWNKDGEMITPWPSGLTIMNTGVVEKTYEACHSLFAGSKHQLEEGVWMGNFSSIDDPQLFVMDDTAEISDVDYPHEFLLCELLYKNRNKLNL